MGFFDDLVGNFTGAKSRKDLTKAKEKADAALASGYETGRADITAGIGKLDPYETGGRAGFDAYLASLGLGGDAARRRVQDAYFNDPIQNALMDRITRANTRAFTARGMSNSGAATSALTNALLANYSAYQDRLRTVGDTGFQAAGGQAGLFKSRGDMAYGYGATKAGNEIEYGNAMAKSRDSGINNLFKLGELGVKAYSAFGGGGGR